MERKIKIDGEDYIKASTLKKVLEELQERDIEVSEEYNDGWDGCINQISDEFDLMVGFSQSGDNKNE